MRGSFCRRLLTTISAVPLPLHIAVAYCASMRLGDSCGDAQACRTFVCDLARQYPAAAGESASQYLGYPLHIMLESGTLFSDDEITQLLEMWPDAAKVDRADSRHYALHLALRRSQPSVALVRRLLQLHPSAADHRNTCYLDGAHHTALDLALKSGNNAITVVLAADLPITAHGVAREHGGSFAEAMANAACSDAMGLLLADSSTPGGLGYGCHTRALLSSTFPSGAQLVGYMDAQGANAE